MDITGTLAKLLATENLTIVHSPSAATASFNVVDRVLTLPVIENAEQETMTMMAAHEVGHALWTPQDWKEQVATGTPFDYVNVIEDVRIEKAIQDKFPGLKRDFSRGYKELFDRDFFALEGEDINDLPLIDRINLHFKLGYLAVVNFSDEEMQWVKAVNECDTFQKVCLVAKMLSDWVDQQQEDTQPQQQTQETDGAGGEEGESNSQQEGNEDKPDFGSKGRKGDEKTEGEGEEEVKEGSTGSEAGEEKVSKTQQAMEKNKEKISTSNAPLAQHIAVSADTDISSIISIKELRESFTHDMEGYSWVDSAEEQLKAFLLSTKKEVNPMVQRFEMKKAADAHARATVNKTGVLNTSRLHQYQLTDDIFLRRTVTHDGKNPDGYVF